MKTFLTFVFCVFIYNTQAQNITNIEYFFDTDPGFNNGTALDLPTSNTDNFEKNYTINVPNLSSGFHHLFVRAKQANNWSILDRKTFFISKYVDTNKKNIHKAEYFFDTDPGFGLGTAINYDVNSTDFTTTIPLGNLSEGFHNLFIRTKNENGVWSIVDRASFFVSNKLPKNITRAEYFFNTDPGFGNGSTITFDTAKEVFNTSIPIGNLNEGFHNLFIRVENENNTWSLIDKATFFITKDINKNINKGEYFFDTDPGFGNATSFDVNSDTETLNLNVNTLTEGDHLLFIRIQNKAGIWSLHDVVSFKIDNSLSTSNLLAKEFSLYPNPVKNSVTVDTNFLLKDYTIYNVSGIKVATGKFTSNKIATNTLSSGVYFFIINSEAGSIVKKIVKQ